MPYSPIVHVHLIFISFNLQTCNAIDLPAEIYFALQILSEKPLHHVKVYMHGGVGEVYEMARA